MGNLPRGEDTLFQTSPGTQQLPALLFCKMICVSMKNGKNQVFGAFGTSSHRVLWQEQAQRWLRQSRCWPGWFGGQGRAATAATGTKPWLFLSQTHRAVVVVLLHTTVCLLWGLWSVYFWATAFHLTRKAGSQINEKRREKLGMKCCLFLSAPGPVYNPIIERLLCDLIAEKVGVWARHENPKWWLGTPRVHQYGKLKLAWSSHWDLGISLQIPPFSFPDLTLKNHLLGTEGVCLLCCWGKEILRTFDKERRVEIKYRNDIKQ